VSSYLQQLQALLPLGLAWPRTPGAILTKLLSGFAVMFAEVHTRAENLLDEIDPRTTRELLPDWERVAALPDSCITVLELDQSIEQRRLALHGKLTAVGGASPAFFIDMAARFGYAGATVEHRFAPMTCNSTCNAALNSEADRSVWILHLPDNGGDLKMTCNSACDSPLATWGDKAIECRMLEIAPAHTTVLFAYS